MNFDINMHATGTIFVVETFFSTAGNEKLYHNVQISRFCQKCLGQRYFGVHPLLLRVHTTCTLRRSVVYQFSCTEIGCQASLDHTTCTLRRRRRSLHYKYDSNAIHKNFITDHLMPVYRQ